MSQHGKMSRARDPLWPYQEHSVYLVVSRTLVSSVHATLKSAKAAVHDEDDGYRIEIHRLSGGIVVPVNEPAERSSSPAPQSSPQNKKDSDDDSMPEHIRELLENEGTALAGMTVYFTGSLPNLSRAQAGILVNRYGGIVVRSLADNTNIVVGEDISSEKMAIIEDLELEVLNEEQFISMIVDHEADQALAEFDSEDPDVGADTRDQDMEEAEQEEADENAEDAANVETSSRIFRESTTERITHISTVENAAGVQKNVTEEYIHHKVETNITEDRNSGESSDNGPNFPAV